MSCARFGLCALLLGAGCGSVYDTKAAAPSAWVATYNAQATESDASSATTTKSAPDMATRLKEAAKLREDGLITEKEYQQLRQRILQQL